MHIKLCNVLVHEHVIQFLENAKISTLKPKVYKITQYHKMLIFYGLYISQTSLVRCGSQNLFLQLGLSIHLRGIANC